MTVAQAIAAVDAMDQWERLRVWWHWMIDHYTDNAKYTPVVRHSKSVSMKEFFSQTYPSVNGPKWTGATEYVQHQYRPAT